MNRAGFAGGCLVCVTPPWHAHRPGIITCFGFCGRDISDWFEQALIVEPVDPFKRGEFHRLGTAPRAAAVDHLGLEQTVDSLGERVVVAVADAADGWLDPSVKQALAVADRDALGGFKRSSQHLDKKAVAMTHRNRRSDRSGRAPLSSPGRPPVAGRDKRRRFWAAIATGMTSEEAANNSDVPQAIGTRWFRKAGGMPPTMFGRSAKPLSGRYLSFAEREEITLLRAQGCDSTQAGLALTGR